MVAKQKVVVLFGGKSNEHSISVASAGGVLGAIDSARYEVIPVGITKSGSFVPVDKDPKSFALSNGLTEITHDGDEIRFAIDGSREIFLVSGGKEKSLGKVDVVFPVLHGQYGEDGTIQGFLELTGIPYVGNKVLASANAMDKEFSKRLFVEAGIPTPDFAVITAKQMVNNPEAALEKLSKLGALPLYVKPARAGSSVGITKVKDLKDLADAVVTALEHDDKVVVEVGVTAREIECGVIDGLGDEPEQVSVAGEIVVTGRDFYDFEAKYLDSDAAKLVCPAELTQAEVASMQQLAKKAFRALGCEGLARVDFFLTKDGFMINEINTMPGFTSISMFPRCFEQSGVSFPKLVDHLIQLALED